VFRRWDMRLVTQQYKDLVTLINEIGE
jgi:hypothetical protein